jgi:hypothetical protein
VLLSFAVSFSVVGQTSFIANGAPTLAVATFDTVVDGEADLASVSEHPKELP